MALEYAGRLCSDKSTLNDGSKAGDWRLPNRYELESLLCMCFDRPALSNAQGTINHWREGEPFEDVQSSFYWTSTTLINDGPIPNRNGYQVNLSDGSVLRYGDPEIAYMWPVRDPGASDGHEAGEATGGFVAGVRKTGQTESRASGDDGDLQKGAAWPVPRFTDNQDGTVKDNMTGLIWLKDANCLKGMTWHVALNSVRDLETDTCGLSDGSKAGDWRLPNRYELESLLWMGAFEPSLSNAQGTGHWREGDPFSLPPSSPPRYFWSSTTSRHDTAEAWSVHLQDGTVRSVTKHWDRYVWPVRGGE